MLDSIYAGIAAVTYVIQTVGNAGRFIFNLNYQVVTALVHYIGQCISYVDHFARLIKSELLTIGSHIAHFVTEIYLFVESLCAIVWRLTTAVCEVLNSAYSNTASVCAVVVDSITCSAEFVRTAVVDMYNLVVAGASHSISFIITAITTAFLLVASLGAACVSFINGVWHGLGFVLSSVAYFPTFLSKTANNAWKRLVEGVADVVLATTKETYLGIVVLCLIYLTLSNFMRYFSCRSLPLFSRRARRRRIHPASADPLQFDLGFESDFEDMYDPDVEGRDRRPPWLNRNSTEPEEDAVNDENSSTSDSNESDTSDNENGDNDANDSDEYTVVTDEDEDSSDADSVNSINSRTFSTGSSDRDIEVQLPPLDQHYSLRSRSSTPARQPDKAGPLSSPEDFNREMERERDKRKCVVCQDEIKSVLVLPCKHMCLCVMCADQIVHSRQQGRRACPLCRTRITKVMNIYV
ncbi:RING finger protein 26 [Plakobranchus ocellatus]|uniref:RING finger protein 26 n=1 Tax=Plakobranchus ocellatus TaxID=259542 RepID=A0AAV4BLW8_9GAST|nr:RING finger protein 26 [Plakobranchus ocellatus]